MAIDLKPVSLVPGLSFDPALAFRGQRRVDGPRPVQRFEHVLRDTV